MAEKIKRERMPLCGICESFNSLSIKQKQHNPQAKIHEKHNLPAVETCLLSLTCHHRRRRHHYS